MLVASMFEQQGSSDGSFLSAKIQQLQEVDAGAEGCQSVYREGEEESVPASPVAKGEPKCDGRAHVAGLHNKINIGRHDESQVQDLGDRLQRQDRRRTPLTLGPCAAMPATKIPFAFPGSFMQEWRE